MNQKEIEKQFDKFNIPHEELPAYYDPLSFTQQIKKVSLYEVDSFLYTNNSLAQLKQNA